MNSRIINFIYAFLIISGLSSCNGNDINETVEVQQLAFEDISGQWSLIRIDTIASKQSLEAHKNDVSMMVEYETSEIKLVDGILKCVHLCPTSYPKKEIEFANDSVFEYVFPTHVRSSNELKIVNNRLDLKGINSIWSNMDWESQISIALNHDTLKIEFLEQTGLFLSEVYVRKKFDQELVDFLRKYRHNLPHAHGKYTIVHYIYEPVDYDSPFEHYHSFPFAIPETLEVSKDDLLQVLQNEYEILLPTDGKLKPYDLSWSWGDNFWVTPKDWYEGPDTSAMILYEKVKEY